MTTETEMKRSWKGRTRRGKLERTDGEGEGQSREVGGGVEGRRARRRKGRIAGRRLGGWQGGAGRNRRERGFILVYLTSLEMVFVFCWFSVILSIVLDKQRLWIVSQKFDAFIFLFSLFFFPVIFWRRVF